MVLAGNYLKPVLVQEAGYDLLKIIIYFFILEYLFYALYVNAVHVLVLFSPLFFP